MVVNGHELPTAFVQLCEAEQRGDAPSTWKLKIDVDAYGNPWQVWDLMFSDNQEEMQYYSPFAQS